MIRRISGVSLPESSTLCTRIATLVQMRRADEASIHVLLTGRDGKMLMEDHPSGAEEVRSAVAKAQATVVGQRPGATFLDDHSIIVHVCGPDQPNVTLVDLPGFHTADDADTKTVNEMVQRYVQMPGTLVLHVIKGDQDYGCLETTSCGKFTASMAERGK